MKVICHLRELRGDRTLKSVSDQSGIAISYLSQIERGTMLPRDEWIPALTAAYGAEVESWYASRTLLALAEDGVAA